MNLHSVWTCVTKSNLFRRKALTEPSATLHVRSRDSETTPASLMPCTYNLKSSYQTAVGGLPKARKKHLHCVTMRRFDKGKGWSSKNFEPDSNVWSKKLSTAALKCGVLRYSVSAVMVRVFC